MAAQELLQEVLCLRFSELVVSLASGLQDDKSCPQKRIFSTLDIKGL